MGSTVRYFRAEQWLDDGAPAEDAGRRPGKGDPALPRRCRTGGAGITAACRQGHGLRLICGAGEASRRAVRLRRQPRNCGGVGLLRVTSIIDIPGVEAQRGVHRRLGTRRAERQQGFDRRQAALRCCPFAEPAGRRPRAVDAACRPAASRTGRTRATALPSWCDFAQHNELHSFFHPRGVLMFPHDRAVDHLHLAVVGFRYGVHQTIPDARLAPIGWSDCKRACKVHISRANLAKEASPRKSTRGSTPRAARSISPGQDQDATCAEVLASSSAQSSLPWLAMASLCRT
jgi:hypothetical protein